eukprot:4824176-Amphidinium_carterae.1
MLCLWLGFIQLCSIVHGTTGQTLSGQHIVASSYHWNCACSWSGVLKCWGYNLHGNLGTGDLTDRGQQPD